MKHLVTISNALLLEIEVNKGF